MCVSDNPSEASEQTSPVDPVDETLNRDEEGHPTRTTRGQLPVKYSGYVA